ncbi:tumor protein p53-inducible nuclear protein 2-like [Ptychodera flava]|uniref:tumor protein p53-inducible nuclear protein 2-like n=1 Tax=Ptychodera flava TaxID=63121 RepID=UPI003969E18D
MLSGISTYIFGASQADQAVPEDNFELQTKDADNEWVLVDIAEKPNISMDGTPVAVTSSAGSSDQSVPLPNVGQEESWFVTPPPCFTAGGHSPIHLEQNPLEDLLIEHPSMSVYGPKHQENNINSPSSAQESNIHVKFPSGRAHREQNVVHRPPRRAAAIAAKLSIKQQQALLVRSQRQEQQKNSKYLSRGKIKQRNKVFHQQSCSRHQRKKNLISKHCMKVSKNRY